MIKFRLYFDKDKETEWLNQMAQKGWAMNGFFWCVYLFEPCEKGAYRYQIDFTDKLFAVSNDYREFMQEMGAEIIANWGFWTILRKPASEGRFELYTDVDSSIEHYTKIRRLFKAATVIELICLFIELSVGMSGFYWGYALAFLIGAFVAALSNICFKTSDIIAEFEERKTGIAAGRKRRGFSPLLSCGLLLNGCALLMDGSVSIYLEHGVQILAIIFMLAGIVLTMHHRRQ